MLGNQDGPEGSNPWDAEAPEWASDAQAQQMRDLFRAAKAVAPFMQDTLLAGVKAFEDARTVLIVQ